jgi:hypothetical protein
MRIVLGENVLSDRTLEILISVVVSFFAAAAAGIKNARFLNFQSFRPPAPVRLPINLVDRRGGLCGTASGILVFLRAFQSKRWIGHMQNVS